MKSFGVSKSVGQTRAQSGSALVFALVVVTSLIALAGAYAATVMSSNKTGEGYVDDVRAQNIVEAGITEVLVSMQNGADGTIGSEDLPARIGDGLFWAESTDQGDGTYRVLVTAMAGSGREAVEMFVRAGSSAEDEVFPAMIFSDNTLNIDSNQTIDSYDSSLGTYASQATNTLGGKSYANDGGDVGSNNDIIVSSNTTIFGNATPGPSSGVSLDSGVTVTGSTAPALDDTSLDVVAVPSASMSGALKVKSNGSIGPGTIQYSSLQISENKKLTVVGPAEIIVNGDFRTNENSKLEIDASNGPVTFYLGANLVYNEKATIVTSTGSPADVAFYFSSASPIKFPGGIDFVGGIYAPKASLSIDSNSEFWGAIVAKSITMSSGTKFHFDEYLLNRTKSSGSGEIEIELLAIGGASLGNPVHQSNRGNPFAMLGVSRDELPSPSEAWVMP